jgi:hypothetical protein
MSVVKTSPPATCCSSKTSGRQAATNVHFSSHTSFAFIQLCWMKSPAGSRSRSRGIDQFRLNFWDSLFSFNQHFFCCFKDTTDLNEKQLNYMKLCLKCPQCDYTTSHYTHNIFNVTANMWKEYFRPQRGIRNVHTVSIKENQKSQKIPKAIFNSEP